MKHIRIFEEYITGVTYDDPISKQEIDFDDEEWIDMEEDENRLRNYIIKARDGRMVFYAKNVYNEEEAGKQFKKETGCGEFEYGKLEFIETSTEEHKKIRKVLRDKVNKLDNELEKLKYELFSI